MENNYNDDDCKKWLKIKEHITTGATAFQTECKRLVGQVRIFFWCIFRDTLGSAFWKHLKFFPDDVKTAWVTSKKKKVFLLSG